MMSIVKTKSKIMETIFLKSEVKSAAHRKVNQDSDALKCMRAIVCMCGARRVTTNVFLSLRINIV